MEILLKKLSNEIRDEFKFLSSFSLISLMRTDTNMTLWQFPVIHTL